LQSTGGSANLGARACYPFAWVCNPGVCVDPRPRSADLGKPRLAGLQSTCGSADLGARVCYPFVWIYKPR